MARDGENEVEVELPLESYGKRKKTIGQVEAQKQLARATRLFGYFFSTFFFGCHIIFHAIGWFIFIKEHLDDWFYVPYLFIFAIIAIYCFIKASFGDPGFLPCNTANINSNNPPPNICTTCQLVRPMRSKHCKYCGRCVARFDHHCPFINNCVGAKNYPYFIGMVISQMANISIALWEGFPCSFIINYLIIIFIFINYKIIIIIIIIIITIIIIKDGSVNNIFHLFISLFIQL